jgi:hypothetical protein
VLSPVLSGPAFASDVLTFHAQTGAVVSVTTSILKGIKSHQVSFRATTGETIEIQVEETDASTTMVRLGRSTIVYSAEKGTDRSVSGTMTVFRGADSRGVSGLIGLVSSPLTAADPVYSAIGGAWSDLGLSPQAVVELQGAVLDIGMNPQPAVFNMSWGCFWSTIGLLASYAGLAVCATPALPACLVQIALHQIAIASWFTSCF